MLIASWNMGCGPPFARFRKTHSDAWGYLLGELRPDVALVQEALFSGEKHADGYTVVWSRDRGSDSGAALILRSGLQFEPLTIRSESNYVAAARVDLSSGPASICSIHVGPPKYRENLKGLREVLHGTISEQRYVVGGDFNAARHFDTVYGGNWYTKYFASLEDLGFHDCHWNIHGREIQSFWGHQAKEKYQLDHIFVDVAHKATVLSCEVVDNVTVRGLSDHGPLKLQLTDQ